MSLLVTPAVRALLAAAMLAAALSGCSSDGPSEAIGPAAVSPPPTPSQGGPSDGGPNHGGPNQGGSNQGGSNQGGSNQGGSNQGGQGGSGSTESVVYTFQLPPTDESISFNDTEAYRKLAEDCSAAQAFLDEKRPKTSGDPGGYGFTGPRFVVLYAAGIATCSGDLATGSFWLDHAIAAYGTAALGPEARTECALYRALRSVLEQEQPTSFECRTDGEVPGWRQTGDQSSADMRRDDPLTLDVDESTPPPESQSGGLPEPAAEEPTGGDGGAPTTQDVPPKEVDG